MPPFGFGRKEQPQSFTTDITDKEGEGTIEWVLLSSSVWKKTLIAKYHKIYLYG